MYIEKNGIVYKIMKRARIAICMKAIVEDGVTKEFNLETGEYEVVEVQG